MVAVACDVIISGYIVPNFNLLQHTFKYKSELKFFCKARLEIDKCLVDESGTMVAHLAPVNHFQYVLMYTFNYKSELRFHSKARLKIDKG